MDSLPRRTALSASYKTATLNQFNNNINNNFNNTDSASTATNSAEDLTLLDKSLRNSMIQDVVHFKKQLVRLRRILQEVSYEVLGLGVLLRDVSNCAQCSVE